jgi:N-acetyl-anhydromuramyl-L-alanine amidase AmpD
MPAARTNYERTRRPNREIRLIIIHVAEAPGAGNVVNQFRAAGVQASAHYVVSRTGHVTQMVPNRSIAWHAGNRFYNRISIGIEHAGYVGVPHSITEPEYRASARLVAHLAEIYRIPLDRQHVIGHNEVPDPGNPGMHGGFDHHRDPGRYWKWGAYMRDARFYEREEPKVRPITPPADIEASRTNLAARRSPKPKPKSAPGASSPPVRQSLPVHVHVPPRHGNGQTPRSGPTSVPALEVPKAPPVRIPAEHGAEGHSSDHHGGR